MIRHFNFKLTLSKVTSKEKLREKPRKKEGEITRKKDVHLNFVNECECQVKHGYLISWMQLAHHICLLGQEDKNLM